MAEDVTCLPFHVYLTLSYAWKEMSEAWESIQLPTHLDSLATVWLQHYNVWKVLNAELKVVLGGNVWISAWLEQYNGHLAQVEVNEMLHLVRHCCGGGILNYMIDTRRTLH